MSRRYNVRCVKAHQTYTAPELACAAGVHLPTVRRWKKLGLEPIDSKRPHLFLGATIRQFWAVQAPARIKLEPGEFYCVACKGARTPRDLLVAIEPYSATSVNLVGTCPTSGHRMRRGVRLSEIAAKLGSCTIAYEDDESTMVRGGDSPQMSLFDGLPA